MTVHGGDFSIGQINAGGVVADGAAVEQFPWFAIRVDSPAADQPGIEKIEPLSLAWKPPRISKVPRPIASKARVTRVEDRATVGR